MSSQATTSTFSSPSEKVFFLFGYPIAHSAAPLFHNHCFSKWGPKNPNSYKLWSTATITQNVCDVLAQDNCGGGAVTMPLKSHILEFLDEISEESRVTKACNTIVKVPVLNGYKLVGQNTDILGVKNALLRALQSQYPSFNPGLASSFAGRGAGLVIGGGATTRSAAYALDLLGLMPIFLVNRDEAEIKAVQSDLPHLDLIHLSTPQEVEACLGGTNAVRVFMAVGAIPCIRPSTPPERMVYTTASAILTMPYESTTSSLPDELPEPKRPIFLEMAYKPRITTMYKIASAHGWHVVDGIQAMVEQGMAQQRMWYRSNPSMEVGSDATIFSPDLDSSVRELCESIGDITPNEPETGIEGLEEVT